MISRRTPQHIHRPRNRMKSEAGVALDAVNKHIRTLPKDQRDQFYLFMSVPKVQFRNQKQGKD